jgi:hypothetical protein
MNPLNRKLMANCQVMLLLTWILTGGSVIMVLQRNLLTLFFALFSLVLLFLRKGGLNKKVVNAFFFSLCFAFACVVVNYIFSIKPQDEIKYVYFLVVVLTSGLFCLYVFTSFTKESFINAFYKALYIVRWHALISAFLLFIVPFLFSIHLIDPESRYTADSFMYIFYKRTTLDDSFYFVGKQFIRNQGLFW